MKDMILLAVCIVLIFALSFIAGGENKQEEIEQRALQLEQKDCYDWQDIELIIFNEVQE